VSSGVPQIYAAGRLVPEDAKKKYCLHRQGHSSPKRFSCTTIIRNIVNHPPYHTASHPRTFQSSATLLWHPRISHIYVRQRTRGKVQPNYCRKAKAGPTCHFDRHNFCLRFGSLVNQRINYPTMQLSVTLHLYNSHHHTPIRLSNTTTNLSVNCRYFSRSTGRRNIARRQLPF